MIGDIVSDINAVAMATQSFRENGSLGMWLATQLAEFRTLPASLRQTGEQVRRVRDVLAANNQQASPAGQLLDDASGLIETASFGYGPVATRVDRLTVAITPVMPQLYAGDFNGDVLRALLSSGGDIAVTLHQVTDLIGKRDAAQRLLQEAVTSPSLPAGTRQQAWASMGTVGGFDMLKVGIGLLIGYVIVRAVWK